MPADPPDDLPDAPATGAPPDPSPVAVLRALERAGSVEAAAQKLGLSAARVRHELRAAADTLDALGAPRPKKPQPQTELPWARRLPGGEPAPPAEEAAKPPRRAAKPPAPAPSPTSTHTPAHEARHPRLRLECDGAARGNPGPAGAGAVLKTPDGRILERLGRWLGVQTNNVAEYEGLLLGLHRALELGARELEVRADSMLVMMQMRGEWKVKHAGLKPLFEEAKGLARRFEKITFAHIPREQNSDADEMSNRAIDERM